MKNIGSQDRWKSRWTYNQLKNQPEKFKDEIVTFLGEMPMFKMIEDYLPNQKGKVIELKDHQQEAINNLEEMRKDGESIALLYHATGERVIIVMGAVFDIKSRVSGIFTQIYFVHCLE